VNISEVIDKWTMPIPHSGCWLWMRAISTHGYAKGSLNGKVRDLHRPVYEALVGRIPTGLHIDHLCRVRHCLNPAHMEPVFQRINTLRGIAPPAEHSKQTECVHGHVFDFENTYVYWDNEGFHRSCRACRNMVQRKRTRRIASAEGRVLGRKRSPKTHCKWGHEYNFENTWLDPKRGTRQCKACWERRRLFRDS
jgi:hypothetical protein